MSKSVFQQSALASGLLTQEELDEAAELLRDSSRKSGRADSDDRLAAKLVSLGRINRWQAEQLRAGRTKFNLGSYHIIDSIGQGGMGQVFKAEHSLMGRVVAVKVLPRSKSSPETVASFMREIRMQAQLDHENLVRAFDAGQDGNVHFLITEYVPGTDLRRLIRRNGRLSMAAGASIISQAALGLKHAHSRGLIHRDVKPGNILVTPEGHTKVSDLGLSGYFHEAEQLDSRGGKVVGTADYLAPEQITAPDQLTPASDIYALGCTLYYTVTGKVPFPGGTARDKARAHLQLPPLDPRRLNPELEDAFVDVIADMMIKNPKERLGTADDVIARLEPWAGEALPSTAAKAFLATGPVVSGTAPQSTPRRPIPLLMNDTEPNFLVQPAEEPSTSGSQSQVSLGTQPVASASEETLPMFNESSTYPISYRLAGKRSTVPWTTWVLIGVGLAATTVLVQLLL